MLKNPEYACHHSSPLIFVRIASVIKNWRVYRLIKVKSAQKGTRAFVTETNYNGSAPLNNFSNIRLCDFQSDNTYNSRRNAVPREASPIKMRMRIEYVVNLSIDVFGAV